MSPTTQLRITIDQHLQDRLDEALASGAARSASHAVTVALTGFLDVHEKRRDPLAVSFDAYVELLRMPRRVSVTGPESYQSELEYAADQFKDYGSFAAMPRSIREHVGGMTSSGSTGYLGNMDGAAHFKPLLWDHPDLIARHLDKVPFAGPVSDELIEEALRGLCSERGMRIPSASRMLAVKRPDLFVPVNGANREEVERHFGRIRYETATGVDDYLGMLGRIHAFPWFRADRPGRHEDEVRRFVWGNRVALLDVLLYAPDVDEGEGDEWDAEE